MTDRVNAQRAGLLGPQHWEPAGARTCYLNKQLYQRAPDGDWHQDEAGPGAPSALLLTRPAAPPLGRSLQTQAHRSPVPGRTHLGRQLLCVHPGSAGVAVGRAPEWGQALLSWARWAAPCRGARLRTLHGKAWNCAGWGQSRNRKGCHAGQAHAYRALARVFRAASRLFLGNE